MCLSIDLNLHQSFNNKAHLIISSPSFPRNVSDINFGPFFKHQNSSIRIINYFPLNDKILLLSIFCSVVFDISPELVFIIDNSLNVNILMLRIDISLKMKPLHFKLPVQRQQILTKTGLGYPF